MYLRFEARSPDGKIARFYELEIRRDLFDQILVARYGRIGTAGQRRVSAAGETSKLMREAERRHRRTAPRRIGLEHEAVGATNWN